MKNSVFFYLILWSAFSWADADTTTTATTTSSTTAGDTVEAFHKTLIEMMQQAKYEDRLNIADGAVSQYFATDTISRISLGSRQWRKLDESTRQSFAEKIQRLITTTYAARFDTFNDQEFKTLQTEVISDDRHRVRTELVTKTETVSLDYQLQHQAGHWHIYDVTANGVSDLSLKRSNYAALMKLGGLDAVTQDIQQEISENEPTPDA